jgi:hypothetical protein
MRIAGYWSCEEVLVTRIMAHLDDILTVAGIGATAYGVSYWSLPAAIVVAGVALVALGALVGATRQKD